MIRKIGLVLIFGIVFYLIWWDINFEEYIQNIAEEKQFEFADSENVQDHLKKIIINAIYRDYSRKIHQLAEQGITVPEGNFAIDVNFNIKTSNDFSLKIIDEKRHTKIFDIYKQSLQLMNKHDLAKLTGPVIREVLDYYRGIPKDPWGLRIEPITIEKKSSQTKT